MKTYYEQLEEKIRQNIKDIEKLNLEKIALAQSRRAWSTENYELELKRIENSILKTKEELNKNQEISMVYILTKFYLDEINSLNNMYKEEPSRQLQDQISEEIEKRKNYIDDKMSNYLPSELTIELRKDYTRMNDEEEDKKVLALQHDKNIYNEAINHSEKLIKDSIKKMNETFAEEKKMMEENSPFRTEEELDRFLSYYMSKKVEENEKLEKAKAQKQNLEKTAKILDKKIIERQRIVKEAKKINISPDDYENIIKRVNKREELDNFLNSLGLNRIVEKGKQVLTPTKEEQEKNKKIIVDRLLENHKKQSERATVKSLPNNKEIKEIVEKQLDNKPIITTNNIKEVVNEELNKETEPKIIKNLDNNNFEEKINYGYRTVIEKLVNGLTPKKKDGKRYRAANIEIKESFKRELSSGNYLYNIVHVVPAIIKLPIQLIRKLTGKIMYKKEAKDRMQTIKSRLETLSDKDLMILLKEYPNHVEQEKFGTGLNILINERITRYANDKVNELNKDIANKYNSLYYCIRELDAVDTLLRRKNITQKQKEGYRNYRANILKGRAQEVASVRKDFEEAKSLLSSGLHGFNENIRATESKMSYIGKRFAKDHDLDVELLEKEAKYERAERKAIQEGNDEMALRIFVASESLLSKNTKVENSVFGKRSTGKKYYSPLAEQLDYSQDPFIKDIFTTVAIVGASMTAISTMHKNNELIEQQRKIEEANTYNEKVNTAVNSTGNIITSKQKTINEGIEAQNYQDSLNISNVLERKALDQSSEVHGGWSVGTNTYYNARSAAQNTYNSFYQTTKNSIQDVTVKYASGEVTQQQAMNMLADISKSSQSTLTSVVNESLPHLAVYARDHAQFDLTGVQEAMNYIVTHPDAIANMNKAMIETTEFGEELANISIQQVATLNSLPSDISTNLFGAASAAALAIKVTDKVETNNKKGKYGNKVTEMVENYVNSQEKLAEELKETSRRR